MRITPLQGGTLESGRIWLSFQFRVDLLGFVLNQRLPFYACLKINSTEKSDKQLIVTIDPKTTLSGHPNNLLIIKVSALWRINTDEKLSRAQSLEEIGFWLKEKPESPEFWIPFIYRDGLDIKQGQAE